MYRNEVNKASKNPVSGQEIQFIFVFHNVKDSKFL